MGRRKTPYQPRLDWKEVSEADLPPFGRTVLVALVKRNGPDTDELLVRLIALANEAAEASRTHDDSVS